MPLTDNSLNWDDTFHRFCQRCEGEKGWYLVCMLCHGFATLGQPTYEDMTGEIIQCAACNLNRWPVQMINTCGKCATELRDDYDRRKRHIVI